jgi:hypothetical protein
MLRTLDLLADGLNLAGINAVLELEAVNDNLRRTLAKVSAKSHITSKSRLNRSATARTTTQARPGTSLVRTSGR